MADVPIDVATLWSLLCSSIFYGVHVVTFGNAVWVMIIKRRRQARRPHLIGVAFVLFAIGTAYLALAFRRILNAFVFFQGPGGAKGQLEQISDMLASVKGSLFITQILTGDMILIYRCFVVYGKDWRAIILPIVLWLGFAIIGAFVVYIPFTLHVHAVLSVARLEPFLISATSLTLAINVFCTSLIVRRIWLAQQQSLRMFSTGGVIQSFRRTIGIIVESAAMYTMTITIFFALELSKNNAEYIVAECIVQIIGIAFNLIIIRVDRGQSVENQPATGTATQSSRTTLQHSRRSSNDYLSSTQRSSAGSFTPLSPRTPGMLARQSSFGKDRLTSSDKAVEV